MDPVENTSCNGMPTNRQQAIIRINDGLFHFMKSGMRHQVSVH